MRIGQLLRSSAPVRVGAINRLRPLRDPRNCWALAQDAFSCVDRKPPPRPDPSWPLANDVLQTMKVRWPLHYENPRAASYFEFALYRFREHVAVELADIEQREPGLVTFEVIIAGEAHRVALDYYDFLHVNENVVRRSALYFKMQHAEEGYGFENVLPAGYVAKRHLLYQQLRRLRSTRDECRYTHDVYGRFSVTFQPHIRRRIAEVLSSQSDFEFEGGTTLSVYSRHLRDIAHSRVCIDVPGQGPLCHRLVDYLAIGSCVVGLRPRVLLPVPMEHGVHVYWIRDDLSDLLDACRTCLGSSETAERLAYNARDYFDRVLHQNQLADYYLYKCIERLG